MIVPAYNMNTIEYIHIEKLKNVNIKRSSQPEKRKKKLDHFWQHSKTPTSLTLLTIEALFAAFA